MHHLATCACGTGRPAKMLSKTSLAGYAKREAVLSILFAEVVIE